MYISRPKYMRQSPDCPLVIFSFTALPSCLHCSTLYSSAFAQHCIVAHLVTPPCCTHLHPHRLYPSRVSPSDPVSLLQVQPLPPISSESQHWSTADDDHMSISVFPEGNRISVKRAVSGYKSTSTPLVEMDVMDCDEDYEDMPNEGVPSVNTMPKPEKPPAK